LLVKFQGRFVVRIQPLPFFVSGLYNYVALN
jgi:hypothetical protein